MPGRKNCDRIFVYTCVSRSYPASSANVMEPAPGFKAKAIVDGEIVDVSTDDYKGKWLVLLFYPKVCICAFPAQV